MWCLAGLNAHAAGHSTLPQHARPCPLTSLPHSRSLSAIVARPALSPRRHIRAAASREPLSPPKTSPEEAQAESAPSLPETPAEDTSASASDDSGGASGQSESSPSLGAAIQEPKGGAGVPQGRIRIKLKSYNVPAIQESVQIILEAAHSTGAKVSGPVYLPTRIRKYTVLTSPHVNKKAREQFEIRTHSRLMDVKDLTPPTVDKLVALELPAGVEVKVTL